MHDSPEQLTEIARLIDEGKVRLVAKTYPFADAIRAQAESAEGHVAGKLVVDVRH